MIKMDGAPISYESMIRESNRGALHVLGPSLRAALPPTKGHGCPSADEAARFVYFSKKRPRDGEYSFICVSTRSLLFCFVFFFFFNSRVFFRCNPLVVLCRSLNKSSWPKNALGAPTINSRPSRTSSARWKGRLGPPRRIRINWPRSSKNLSMNVKVPWQGLRMPRLRLRTNASFSSPRS